MLRRISLFVFGFVFVSVASISSCNTQRGKQVILDVTKAPFKTLSEYNFFGGTMADLKPNERVVPYDLITPLFTDYAFKARFVYVPDGKTADYDTADVINLPVGACLIKNFYYPADFRKPDAEKRIIETRLLIHRNEGWEALDYIWNDEQTEANLENAGDIKKVSWTHYDGSQKEIEYLIPNKNQCKGCHWSNETSISPIGPKVRNLNKDYAYADGTENQISKWVKMGFVKQPVGEIPKLPDWTDSLHYSVAERSRAYLEMNCAHCHRPTGPAYTSGLYLDINNANIENLGICKTPVAAGKATGNRFYDIVPGKPDESILMFRVETDDPGTRMPEVGRTIVHTEGVNLLRQWIAEMSADACSER